MYTEREREKKSIFGYCNWQACTVVYATVKYLLYHLYIAKTTQQIEKYIPINNSIRCKVKNEEETLGRSVRQHCSSRSIHE